MQCVQGSCNEADAFLLCGNRGTASIKTFRVCFVLEHTWLTSFH